MNLYEELDKLARSDKYPLHMPGHKRNTESTPFAGAFRCDITEIDGYDNLHDENGIILEAEERANKLYGADKTYFLVNGSTAGVLSAVSAAVHTGGTILAARGSHKSFYHAAYLRQLNVKYLPYKEGTPCRLPLGYTAKEVRNELEQNGDVQAVFIISPTYEGIRSDVSGIVAICHERGIPLIVDAAHGAHFGFKCDTKTDDNLQINTDEYSFLPENAVSQGADIVIHSVHKTLPSMTQTALIHVQGELVDRSILKRFLRVYQSSSPSYILMSSIDLCMKEMQENGTEYVKRLLDYRNRIQKEAANCRHIKVLGREYIDDAAKLVIYTINGEMTGKQLYDILREDFGLQLEMAGERYALAIITGSDTKEGIQRLINALLSIDDVLTKEAASQNTQDNQDGLAQNSHNINIDISINENKKSPPLPTAALPIHTAWDSPHEVVALDSAAGRIAGEFVNLYPPGIPLVVPGEIISSYLVEDIKRYIDKGMNVQGIFDNIGNEKGIICVEQK